MSESHSATPSTTPIHEYWSTFVGAQHGITTSHMVVGGLIGLHGFLRTNTTYKNLPFKAPVYLGAVIVSFLYGSQPAKNAALATPPVINNLTVSQTH